MSAADRLAQLALRLVKPMLFEPTAEAWHMHCFGQTSVDAKAVRAHVEARGWPRKLPGVLAKEAGHARDAGGVALYAAHLAGAA